MTLESLNLSYCFHFLFGSRNKRSAVRSFSLMSFSILREKRGFGFSNLHLRPICVLEVGAGGQEFG